MKKGTFYEVLEVSENASGEIIEKAYKVLAKKYHPDLQSAAQKKSAEEKMKTINEAYDVLGDPEKRKEYDAKLAEEREQERLRQEQAAQNYSTQQTYQQTPPVNSYSPNITANNNMDADYERRRQEYERKLQKEEYKQRKKMQENLNKEYENAYYNYLKNLGYNVKRKWTKENFKDLAIVLLIMAGIITILWFIPPSHDWMVNFYENNPIIKTVVNIVGSIIVGIFLGIWNFITGLFGG